VKAGVQVGLDLMVADGGVFTCHGGKLQNAEAISALRASLLILENRYNLDCLMQRYQGAPSPFLYSPVSDCFR
jgi:hypothetical protein